MSTNKTKLRSAGLSFGLMLAASGSVWGSPILPGFDLFQTGLTGTAIEHPDQINNPGDWIALTGNAIGPGTTDTIVERLQGIDPLPEGGGSGIIDIELVGLSLRSIVPVDLTGGGLFADIYAVLYTAETRDLFDSMFPASFIGAADSVIGGLAPSLGQMEVFHTDLDADFTQGTFNSCFGDTTATDTFGTPLAPCATLGNLGSGVFAAVIATAVNDASTIFFATSAPAIELASTATLWQHLPPPSDPNRGGRFQAGSFYPGETLNHSGPHGGVCVGPEGTTQGQPFSCNGDLTRAIPAPISALLFVFGLPLLWLRRRKLSLQQV